MCLQFGGLFNRMSHIICRFPVNYSPPLCQTITQISRLKITHVTISQELLPLFRARVIVLWGLRGAVSLLTLWELQGGATHFKCFLIFYFAHDFQTHCNILFCKNELNFLLVKLCELYVFHQNDSMDHKNIRMLCVAHIVSHFQDIYRG